jgi:ribosome maturation protein SDO1
MTVGIDKAVVSRLTVSGQKFEILVDPDKALEFKKGAKIDISAILAAPGVYKNVSSTDRVSEQDLQKNFGTTDFKKIAERIVREGELQLTTDQRRRMVEERKNQIATIISKKGINPQTNAPNPPQRVLNSMEKAGVHIDPFVDAELQVEKIVKEIRQYLPIKFQKITLQIKIPPQFAGRSYDVLKRSGTIAQEQWLNDGSLQVNIQIVGGMQGELFDKLSSLTHGSFESKIVSKEDV